ncbi:MAG: STAS domain-containing protein [Deltaproteobacteria bacterium]|jgi:anti-anti-sigma regulatory factor|nr:STAS domain-containing protein [Deltaproteobacteria bacterium]
MTKIKIRGPLSVSTIAQHRAALLEAGATPLDLDLKAVDELDTAGLQLLLEVHRARGLRLASPSAAVTEVLNLLHLNEHFPRTRGAKTHDAG